MSEIRTCRTCEEVKPIEDFPLRRKGGESRQLDCRPCFLALRRKRERKQNSQAKKERYADPKQRRIILSQQHKWRYGITLDEKDALLEAQGGVCALCKTDTPGARGRGWVTDHDHACCPEIKSCGNCIRGILCHRCNFALGLLDDDVEKFEMAIEYLKSTAMLAGLSSTGRPDLRANVKRRIPA